MRKRSTSEAGKSSRQNLFAASRSNQKCLPARSSATLFWGPAQKVVVNGNRCVLTLVTPQQRHTHQVRSGIGGILGFSLPRLPLRLPVGVGCEVADDAFNVGRNAIENLLHAPLEVEERARVILLGDAE